MRKNNWYLQNITACWWCPVLLLAVSLAGVSIADTQEAAKPLQPRSAAPPLALALPVDCALGEDCFIQYYVDINPDPIAEDYQCTHKTYDGHEGVDFRVASKADLDKGIEILAAANGVVIDVINHRSEPDMLLENVPNNDCGNMVRMAHLGGWVTQYCHLKQGSVSVSVGDELRMGQVLGQMGLSGSTTFPHLHFAVRLNGIAVDPFTGTAPHHCGMPTDRGLWQDNAIPVDSSTALLGAGITRDHPSLAQGRDNPEQFRSALAGERFIYIWAHLLGLEATDMIRLRLVDPSGALVADEAFIQRFSEAESLINIGVEPADGGYQTWPEGSYIAQILLFRDEKPYFEWVKEVWLSGSENGGARPAQH